MKTRSRSEKYARKGTGIQFPGRPSRPPKRLRARARGWTQRQSGIPFGRKTIYNSIMFHPEDLARLQTDVKDRTAEGEGLFQDLLRDVEALKGTRQRIAPRTGTAIALMASDGGNIQLKFDPFHIQIVRVVNSQGKSLCLDIVSAHTDPDTVLDRHRSADGEPQSPLGILMRDLDCLPAKPTLNDLLRIPIKTGSVAARQANWVERYRDVVEWAGLYELICHRHPASDCLIVRDGLLRGYVFKPEVFREIVQRMRKRIDAMRRVEQQKVYLVGIAKRSKVLDRYNLAMNVARLWPSGSPYFVPVPFEMERKTFSHLAYVETAADDSRGLNAGALHFVRFGAKLHDRVWAVDVFKPQEPEAATILGHLLHDAKVGFPIPYYPYCLQQAHEHAQIGTLDASLLQDAILDSIRSMIPREKRADIEAYVLQTGGVETFI